MERDTSLKKREFPCQYVCNGNVNLFENILRFVVFFIQEKIVKTHMRLQSTCLFKSKDSYKVGAAILGLHKSPINFLHRRCSVSHSVENIDGVDGHETLPVESSNKLLTVL